MLLLAQKNGTARRTASPGIPPRPHVPPASLPAHPPLMRLAANTLGSPLARTEKTPSRLPSFPPAEFSRLAPSIVLAGSRRYPSPGFLERSAAKYPPFPCLSTPHETALNCSSPPLQCPL